MEGGGGGGLSVTVSQSVKLFSLQSQRIVLPLLTEHGLGDIALHVIRVEANDSVCSTMPATL